MLVRHHLVDRVMSVPDIPRDLYQLIRGAERAGIGRDVLLELIPHLADKLQSCKSLIYSALMKISTYTKHK